MKINYKTNLEIYLTTEGKWTHVEIDPIYIGNYFVPYKKDKSIVAPKKSLFITRKVAYAPLTYLGHKVIFN